MTPRLCQLPEQRSLSTNPRALVNFERGRSLHNRLDRGFQMTMPDDRLTTLEIRAAEQEKTIEELSGQIAEQWKVIERMQRKLDALADRFLALEEQAAPDVPVTKPPHW
jgi:SlyX protein